MAKFYLPFDLADKAGTKIMEIDAPDLESLLKKAGGTVGIDMLAEAKKWAVLVNGLNIHLKKGWKTPLSADDEVFFVAGSGGG
jgi:molybdopterin converting factor small subunit